MVLFFKLTVTTVSALIMLTCIILIVHNVPFSLTKTKEQQKKKVTYFFMNFLRRLCVTKSNCGHILEDRHLDWAVPPIQQGHQGAWVHRSIGNRSSDRHWTKKQRHHIYTLTSVSKTILSMVVYIMSKCVYTRTKVYLYFQNNPVTTAR